MEKKDFKQKYFLYCQDCKTEKLVQKFAQLKDNQYIYKRRIKIEEYGELTRIPCTLGSLEQG